jgi:hypothetical protein
MTVQVPSPSRTGFLVWICPLGPLSFQFVLATPEPPLSVAVRLTCA